MTRLSDAEMVGLLLKERKRNLDLIAHQARFVAEQAEQIGRLLKRLTPKPVAPEGETVYYEVVPEAVDAPSPELPSVPA